MNAPDLIPPFWACLLPRGRLQMQRHLRNIRFFVKIWVRFDLPKYRKSRLTPIHLKLLAWMSPDLMPPFWGRPPPSGRLQMQRHLRNIGFWVKILVSFHLPKWLKSRPTQIHLNLLAWMSPDLMRPFWRRPPPRQLRNIGFFVKIWVRFDLPKYRKSIPT